MPGSEDNGAILRGGSGAGTGGFSVVDDDSAPLWSEFQRFGGVGELGYPVSDRFLYGGLITQSFQRAVLQFQPELGAANNVAKASSKLVVLWPAFAIAATALASFWVGERREKKILKAHEKVEGTPFAAPPSPPPPAKPAA